MNANAKENPNSVNVINCLVQNFGSEQVSTCDGGVIKLQVKELGNGDILSISNLLQWSDIRIKRSNTRLLVLFVPKPWFGEYSPETLAALETIEADVIEDLHPIPLKTVRDYFELVLSDDHRLKAFNNAANNNPSCLDEPAQNLFEAIMKACALDLDNANEGSDYWTKVLHDIKP